MAMPLDIQTVTLVTVLLVLLECGILTALWAIHREFDGIGYWAAGAGAISVGALAIYLRAPVAPASVLVPANIIIIAGVIVTWWGLERFFDRPAPYRAGILILLASAAGLVFYGLIRGDMHLRLIVILITLTLMNSLRAYSVLRKIAPEMRLSQVFCGGVTLLQTGVTAILLIAATVMIPAAPGQVSRLPIAAWAFLLLLILSVAAVFAIVLMVNQKLQAQLIDAAQRDRLTGAMRRHALEEYAGREIARCLRHRRPLALLLLDLDHFKTINDRFGHHAGDEALQRFASVAQACLRREDLFGRTGGEEFCILAPDTDEAGASGLAERIRTTVEAMELQFDGQTIHMTVSIGIAMLPVHGSDWTTLTRAADIALYRAKSDGRNLHRVAATTQD